MTVSLAAGRRYRPNDALASRLAKCWQCKYDISGRGTRRSRRRDRPVCGGRPPLEEVVLSRGLRTATESPGAMINWVTAEHTFQSLQLLFGTAAAQWRRTHHKPDGMFTRQPSVTNFIQHFKMSCYVCYPAHTRQLNFNNI